MATIDLLILVTVSLCCQQFLAVSFDEAFAGLRGVPVNFLYLLLLCMVTVVLLATLLGALFTVAGLFISDTPDLPAGATIILVAGVTYMISLLFTTGWKRRELRWQLTKVVQ